MSGGTRKEAARLPRWRLILLLLALLGFLIFFLPVFGGILNPANAGAMAGFLGLAAVWLWWPGFLRLLGRLWARTWTRILLLASGLGLLALLIVVLVFCGRVIARFGAVPELPCPTVIVLGCQVRGTVPSRSLSCRIETTAEYLRENPGSVAVLSGGRGDGENLSEAACMYRELVARGIDPARLYREEASATTWENLRNSLALMDREGLEQPAALVSSDLHLCRALEMAEDLGLSAQGLAAPTSWYSRPTYVLREALALLVYRLTNHD